MMLHNENRAHDGDLAMRIQRVHLLQTLRDYEGDARSLFNQIPQNLPVPATSAPQ